MKIFVIDNYDSFTYNLVHLLESLDVEVTVKRNDQFEMDEIKHFDKILISPGPGIPDEAGQTKAAIEHYAGKLPILGVCLGHQSIAEVFGGRLKQTDAVYHGIDTPVQITDQDEVLFEGLDETITVGRYHSWFVDEKQLPASLKVTSQDSDGNIMALSHTEMDVKGIQFHPESILTENGKEIIENWLKS